MRGDMAEPNEIEPPQHLAMYSPIAVLSHKDFGKMSETEVAQVRRLITSMARQMATALSRRQKARIKSHVIDRGRTLRQSLRYGGEVINLKRRGPKVGKTKMVLLCDISGSMNVYTNSRYGNGTSTDALVSYCLAQSVAWQSHYQPLCKGIYTALPYIYDFMPVHNAESLRLFGRLIARVA
jgi:uncharacterized protein with von Willebrand factor type A (vWA) domain